VGFAIPGHALSSTILNIYVHVLPRAD
jgi:hypothetical protein